LKALAAGRVAQSPTSLPSPPVPYAPMLDAQKYGFSSKNLCHRPRDGPCTRTGTPLSGVRNGVTNSVADDIVEAEIAAAEERKAVDRLEQQLRDALFARTTAHMAEHRVLTSAFQKFDTDMSGSVDMREFSLALEHLGLHQADAGLPGQGGLAPGVVGALFRRYDVDGSGHLEYAEFRDAMLAPDKLTKML